MAQTTQPVNSVLGAGKPSNALYGSDLMVELAKSYEEQVKREDAALVKTYYTSGTLIRYMR